MVLCRNLTGEQDLRTAPYWDKENHGGNNILTLRLVLCFGIVWIVRKSFWVICPANSNICLYLNENPIRGFAAICWLVRLSAICWLARQWNLIWSIYVLKCRWNLGSICEELGGLHFLHTLIPTMFPFCSGRSRGKGLVGQNTHKACEYFKYLSETKIIPSIQWHTSG